MNVNEEILKIPQIRSKKMSLTRIKRSKSGSEISGNDTEITVSFRVERTQDIERKLLKIQENMQEVLNELMLKKKGEKNRDWFDEKCWKVINERNTARMEIIINSTEENRNRYHQKRRKEKSISRVEDYFVNGNKKRVSRGKKKKKASNMISCKIKDGQLLGNLDKRLERRAEHVLPKISNEDNITEIQDWRLEINQAMQEEYPHTENKVIQL